MIILFEFVQFGNEVSQVMQFMLLKYGCDVESEFDKLGVEYFLEVGYDVYQMVGFFQILDCLMGGVEGCLFIFLFIYFDLVDCNLKVG